MKSLATEIVESIIELGLVEKAIIEGDSTIFVWAANYEEQLEARLGEILGNRIRQHAKNPDSINEFLDLVTHGIRKGDSIEVASSLAACGFALKALEIKI